MRNPRLALGLAALIFASAAALFAFQEGEFDLERTSRILRAEIQKALREEAIPSISIALVRDGQIVWTDALGYANLATRAPATPETIYITGSTFKTVTATAIMQLAERGLISLDDPVNQYLGDTPIADKLQSDKPVTFRHILTHTSGLPNGAATVPIWNRKLPRTLEELTSSLRTIRAPEEQTAYSNLAFGMAGFLIERISGESFTNYVYKNVLLPVGVETSGFVTPTPRMVERIALPYVRRLSGEVEPLNQVFYDVYPAGDIYLTAADMARFLGAHLNGGEFNGRRILEPESVREMHRRQFSTGNFGLGWSVARSGDHTIISHGGAVPGINTYMMGDVESGVGVYAMANSGNAARSLQRIASTALRLLRGERFLPRDNLGAVIAEILGPLARADGPGLAVLVKQGDETETFSFGLADIERRVPVSADTVFGVGSVTKQFTAAAILLLQEEGKLSFDDPVQKHLADYPEKAHAVTIRHLLNHTSGTPSYTGLPAWRPQRTQRVGGDRILEMFQNLPLQFEPGTQYRYSNSGYYLLGLIVERASGRSYREFMRERVFEPLGLEHTSVYDNAELVAHRASGYAGPANAPARAVPIHFESQAGAAGAIVSTVGDLAEWVAALEGGRLISAESYAAMTTPPERVGERPGQYAFGLNVGRLYDRRHVSHGGSIDGFNAYISWFPEEDVVIAALANHPSMGPARVARAVADHLFGEGESSARREIELSEETLQAYVGKYELRPGAVLDIGAREGGLTVQPTGQSRRDLFAASETLFFLKAVEAEITFEKDEKGEITALILHQNGIDRRANRIR